VDRLNPQRLHRFRWASAAALALGLHAPAHALFTVNQPWVKPGAATSEAYMVLTSTEGATLIGIRSSLAARASLRNARSVPMATLALPAGRAVALRPDHEHIVLAGLSRPLKLGDRVPLTLVIESADGVRQEIPVDAEVRKESPYAAELRAHRH